MRARLSSSSSEAPEHAFDGKDFEFWQRMWLPAWRHSPGTDVIFGRGGGFCAWAGCESTIKPESRPAPARIAPLRVAKVLAGEASMRGDKELPLGLRGGTQRKGIMAKGRSNAIRARLNRSQGWNFGIMNRIRGAYMPGCRVLRVINGISGTYLSGRRGLWAARPSDTDKWNLARFHLRVSR